MSHNKLIKLDVMRQNSWLSVVKPVMLLAAISSWFGSQVMLAILLLLLVLSFNYIAATLGLFKVYKNKLTLIIFADGQVRLESANKIGIEGVLGKSQWCSGHAAIIQLVAGHKAHRRVVFRAQQKNKDEYRRLRMWLRQDFYRDTRDVQVSGN